MYSESIFLFKLCVNPSIRSILWPLCLQARKLSFLWPQICVTKVQNVFNIIAIHLWHNMECSLSLFQKHASNWSEVLVAEHLADSCRIHIRISVKNSFFCSIYSTSGNSTSGTITNRTTSPVMPRSPVQITKYENPIFNSNSPHPIGINSVSSSNSNVKAIDTNSLSPRRTENEDYVSPMLNAHFYPFYLCESLSER